MSEDNFDSDRFKKRMDGAVSSLKQEFMSLRSGRAHSGLLESINVEAYGQKTPVSQLGTVSVPEPRMLSLQVWDKNMVEAVDKAIRNSHLGINPVVDGQILRLPVPPLNEERREELAKVSNQYAEQARIAVRNVRRDAMDQIKKSTLSEDQQKTSSSHIQKMTDDTIAVIDAVLKSKKEEILSV